MRPHSMIAKFLKVILALTTVGSLGACQGKDSGTSVATTTGSGLTMGFPPGTGGTATGEIIRSISLRPSGSQQIELGLRLFSTTGGSNVGGVGYVGPVLAQGYVEVASANWSGCTVIPLGRYSIRTGVANGYFTPDKVSTPWNLTNFNLELVHSSGFVAQMRIDYAEFRDMQPRNGVDGLTYYHTMYGQTVISTPVRPVSCYWGPVTLFFPWSL